MSVAVNPAQPSTKLRKSPGFWKETWRRFRRQKLAMAALCLVAFLALVALFTAIAGTKPVVCCYKGKIYFPALAYFNSRWENPVFQRDKFRKRYPQNLKEKDPESWAVWPLVFQDPYRRVRDGEWRGRPGNPTQDQGRPNRYNFFGTDKRGVDVFAQMVHGTTIALLVGFVSMSIAAVIGITTGAIAGYSGGWPDMLLSRAIEVVMCVPALVLILALLAVVETPTIWHMMAVMNEGLIVEFGPSESIYADPKDDYTKRLIKAIPNDSIENITRRQEQRKAALSKQRAASTNADGA